MDSGAIVIGSIRFLTCMIRGIVVLLILIDEWNKHCAAFSVSRVLFHSKLPIYEDFIDWESFKEKYFELTAQRVYCFCEAKSFQ